MECVKVAKGVSQNTGLYTPISVPKKHWNDISIDFFLGLLRTAREYDLIFFVVDIFSKMTHFIPSKKTFDLVHVTDIFFKEIIRLHGVPRIIISNRDNKFVGYFLRTLWN